MNLLADGGAQHLEVITGLLLTGQTVDNIFGSADEVLNLYYDPTQGDNQYLGGLTYDFASGSGKLIPIATRRRRPPPCSSSAAACWA